MANPTKPKWYETWQRWIRTAETAIVIGLWCGGLTELDQPAVAAVFFLFGTVIGSISIFSIPTRSVGNKLAWVVALVLFFALSQGFVIFHATKSLADTESADLAVIQQSAGAKIEITQIGASPNDGGIKPGILAYRVTYENKGTLDSEVPNFFPILFLSDASNPELAIKDQDKSMNYVISQAFSQKFKDSGNQASIGNPLFFDFSINYGLKTSTDIANQKKLVGLAIVFKYTDASTPPGYAKYTYFCGYLINGGLGGWEYCHSYNKVFTAKN